MKEEEPYESVRNFNKYTTSFISSERRIEDASNIYSMKREMRHSLSFMEDGFYPSESSSDCSGDHSSTYTIDDDVDKKYGTITPLIFSIRVITKLPNSEQSYKGKVKTHNYINKQNQSTELSLAKAE
jgi:hypothetical protein